MSHKVYVTNHTGDSVSVIDGATNTVAGPIAVGNSPYGVAVDSVSHKVYVPNSLDHSVSVIDGATNAVTGTIAVGNSPFGVAVDSVSHKVYVANFDGDSVSVIDGTTDAVTDTVGVGDGPHGVGVDSVSHKVYVANFSVWSVSVIRPPSVPDAPRFVSALARDGKAKVSWGAPSHDGGTAITGYTVTSSPGSKTCITASATTCEVIGLTNGTAYTFTVTATNELGTGAASDASKSVTPRDTVTPRSSGYTVSSPTAVGPSPFGVGVDSVMGKVFVANGDGSMSVIDAASNGVTTVTASLGGVIAVDPTLQKVFSVFQSGRFAWVSVFDETTNAMTADRVRIGQGPAGIAVDSVSHKVYVTNSDDGSVSVIDGSTNMVTATVAVGDFPTGIAVDSVSHKVYVTDYGDGVGSSVSVIDGASNTVTATVALGG